MKKGCAALAAFGLVTVVSWWASQPTTELSAAGALSQLLGGLALVGFGCLMILATRIRLLDSLFGGLDKAYVAHKWLAIVSVGLALAHVITLPRHQPQTADSALGSEVLAELGGPALVAFVVLSLVAVLAKKLKYESWKHVHAFMVVPYVVGLAHYLGLSSYDPWGLTPFSVWMGLVNVAGLSAAVYSVFWYERIGFPYSYKITGLRLVADRTVEITGRPLGRSLPNRPGQFVFVKVPERGFGSHPFTISQATDAQIEFAVKALGDQTSSLVASAQPHPSGPADGVRVGDTLRVSRAHGRFDFTAGQPRQVWIAGGIGITPFLAFLRAGVPDQYSVDLFYSYAGDEGAYVDELRSLAAPHVRVHLVDTRTAPLLTAEKIAASVDLRDQVDVYFCGPGALRGALAKDLRALGARSFHAEEFAFGRTGGGRTRRSVPVDDRTEQRGADVGTR